MHEAVRYGNAGCVVHGPRRGGGRRVTVLFSGPSAAPWTPVGGAYRKGPFPGPAPPAPGGHGPSGR